MTPAHPTSSGSNAVEVLFHLAELIYDHGFEQQGLAWKGGIEGFLAHPELARQIVHRDVSETVAQEMAPRGSHDPFGRGTALGRKRLPVPMRGWSSLGTPETIPVLLVSSARVKHPRMLRRYAQLLGGRVGLLSRWFGFAPAEHYAGEKTSRRQTLTRARPDERC